MSEDLQKAITELKAKQATIKVINDTQYLLYRGDIDAEAEELVKEESESTSNVSSHTVLHAMKGDDYKTYLEEQQKELKCEVNDACLSKYTVQRTIDILKKVHADDN